jgi:hypothetical protein
VSDVVSPLTNRKFKIFENDQVAIALGLTAVFLGYFSVWLPGPSAGLRFIGLEMGEWIKFLGVDMSRNLFYLPPITLGLLMVLWTVFWPNRRWQTWGMRGLAIFVSMLSFPAWEDFRGPAQIEYMPRIWLIGVVITAVFFSAFWRQFAPERTSGVWLLMAVVGVLGAILPFWIYTAVTPVVEQILQMSLGIGVGVVLNGAGHLLVTAVSLKKLVEN